MAAIAVPAVAAPDHWQPIDSLAQQAPAIAAPALPMAFELPGNSFPGSAFYFLEDAPRMALASSARTAPLFDITGTGRIDADQLVQTHDAGPAARAFMAAGDGISKARALQCLTSAIYYEAASETVSGQRAVAQVVLNRVAHSSYPASVCGVVYQGSQRRTGCQFSFTCDGSLARTPAAAAWDRARAVAQDALSGESYQPIGLATHYHTIWINPYWASSLDPVGTIGAHRFYRWRGAAGQPDAFRGRYSGYEPLATIAAHRASDRPSLSAGAAEPAPAPALAPALSQATGAPATGDQNAGGVPSYSAVVTNRGGDRLFKAENLPEAGGIRPEYAHSGRWISQPR